MRSKPLGSEPPRRLGILRLIRRILLWAVSGAVAAFVFLVALGWYLDRSAAEKQCQEDLTAMQNMVQKTRADHMLDQNHYPAAQKALEAMQTACLQRDTDKVRAIAMNLVFYLSFAGDEANVKPEAPQPGP